MARFLIGWELGASSDLLLDAADIGYALLERGHEVHLAVGDPVTLATLLDLRVAAAILPAPIPPLRPDLVMKPPKEGGITDKLALQGFATATILSGLAIAWSNLLKTVAPDAVIAMGAPVLSLAARGKFKLLVTGSVETFPPVAGENLPRLHAHIAPTVSDAQLLQNADAAARLVGARTPDDIAGLLRGDREIVYGLSQFDPYGALRREPARPLGPLPTPIVPASRPSMTAILDVYFPGIETLVIALTDFGKTPVHVHVRGMTRPMFAFLSQNPNVTVHAAYAEAISSIADATYVLHHASARVATACLAQGVPQVLLPVSVEQNAVADMLQRMNVGLRFEVGTNPVDIADRLLYLFRNLDMVQNAQHTARQLAVDPRPAAMSAIVEAAENLASA